MHFPYLSKFFSYHRWESQNHCGILILVGLTRAVPEAKMPLVDVSGTIVSKESCEKELAADFTAASYSLASNNGDASGP